MVTLQKLFGLNRDRFPKSLPECRAGRKTLYGFRAVTKIMDWLLSEKMPDRKKDTRGGSARKLWLSNPTIRVRVLRGIEARAKSVSQSTEIKKAFKEVGRRYLPNSAK